MPLSFNLISLGCPKNQVDSENIFTRLEKSDIRFTSDSDSCDICVVNTCGFIEAARKESIGVIMEAVEKKKSGAVKYIAVTGCMVNNNIEILKKELPEVDIFLATFDEEKIVEEIETAAGKKISGRQASSKEYKEFEREHFNLKSTAYLKISEGCSRSCSFCTIPSIRGAYRSKSIEEIKKEAAYLASAGVEELIIVSQDTSYYGTDAGVKNGLYVLLKELIKIKGVKWIRLMYLYPSAALFTDDLISLFNNEEKILKYIDMPVQHISDKILKLMKRGESKKDVLRIIEKIKNEIPGAALRTSLIIGFPGETDKDFEELSAFVKDVKFDNLGVFKYSDEMSAVSYKYNQKVSAKIKSERYKILMETQKSLIGSIMSKHIGRTYEAVIDEINNKTVKLRTYFQSPDIDGYTYMYSEDLKNSRGYIAKKNFIYVNINKIKGYDLLCTPSAI
ncbi:MAG: 30S ribosomal protein S12 methylthiotransferase RimO [Deltaproteobacteria bacterium]|uniref:Ribosomal protein uS12 methylthiotransferase RimO n=1 Tax=Candidatus Acidulodesulfobacterium acidiphilum TaxID=2597224 RepID=A0A520XF82_9DELT|nr:30S ribosomal protein S12 methylthiotransferase RimO [Deltaproteobacteria bacterium]MDA8299091.1 30S ribosomal protein S12 methylthiotransferase RimO [Deltaproteobacteria bacterium]RZV39755.1 MAG: 30S ribosomal protein S12 methylthiotransferase RimO [Candidatus Acidulodesulfobacterium acidiphilum]